jgi:uncharacterized membrane protein
VSQSAQQRFAILGAMIPMFAVFGVRAAKEYGWSPSKAAAGVFVIGIGLFCIAGGIIAYRTTRAQVRRDLKDLQNTGRVR